MQIRKAGDAVDCVVLSGPQANFGADLVKYSTFLCCAVTWARKAA